MSRTGWIALAAGFAVAAALIVYNRWSDLAGGDTVAERPVSVPEERESAAPPAIRHPIPAPEPELPEADSQTPPAEPEPLPPLDESDPVLRDELGGLLDERAIASLLNPKRLVANIVVTVDNLDHQALSLRYWPVQHVQESPAVEKRARDAGGERLFLVAANARRYDAHVQALRTVDAQRLVDLYVHYYPLFQEAYEDLGYPDRYFNDRMIDVIDHLLATPEVAYPIELVQPEVLYEFAARELEARSWGQKTLIRMGPAHRAAVKDKLREIRAAIVARAPRDGG